MAPMTTEKIKFLCSYGGRIMPRLSDGKLRYVGGHTRVLSVDRSISFSELMVRLGEFCGASVRMKCQLPDGDLETLISITSDEDLRHILAIYDSANSTDSSHSLKIRAILSPLKSLKSISPPPLSPPSRLGLVNEVARRVTGGRPFVVNGSSFSSDRLMTYGVVQQRGNWIV